MATYTGIADASGDFTVPFSANYTSGQKITVTAEKDAATKTIELFAPSEVIAPPATPAIIQFSGNLTNFPANIATVTISGISGKIADYSFYANNDLHMWAKATGLIIGSGVTIIGQYAFANWMKAKIITIASTVTSIMEGGLSGAYECEQLICLATVPPTLGAEVFYGLSPACVIKVPAASVAAYKAKANWKFFASQIQAI